MKKLYSPFFLRTAFVVLLMLTFVRGWGQTPVPMSSQPSLTYIENFNDITNWAANFSSGIGANRWASYPITAGGSSNDGKRTTKTSAVFSTTTNGGVQKGTGNLVFLSTGSSATSEAVAVDFLLDFTGVNAGVLSFDWAAVDNGGGTRPTSLRVFWSIDNSTFTEISSAQVIDIQSVNNNSITNVILPTAFNNSATARLRFYNHAGTVVGSGNRDKISIDNVKVTATATPTNDTTSEVDGPVLASQPNPVLISSLVDTDAEAVKVFDFDIYDYGTADGLPTHVTQVTIKPGTNNTTNWANSIQNAKLSLDGGTTFVTTGTPVITAGSIVFPITSGNLDIADSDAETASLFVYLKNSGLVDNSVLEFNIPATAHGFTASSTGSTFATTFPKATVSNQMLIDVVASKLIIGMQPAATGCPNTNLSTASVFRATDANNNVDTNFTSQITVSNSGSLGMTNNSLNAVAGVATFLNLQFTATGTVTLTASATGLTSSPASNSVVISVANAAGFGATNGNAQSIVSWANLSSCFDEVIIVAKAGSAVTASPSGDGSAYTGDLSFSAGTSFDGGFVIYKGITPPQTLTNLINGTTYHLTIFTRRGTAWSSGATTTCTPNLSSSSADHFRTSKSGNWSDTTFASTPWESSATGGPADSEWITATLAPTSVATSIQIRGGHTITSSANNTSRNMTIDATGVLVINTNTFALNGVNNINGTLTRISTGVFTNNSTALVFGANSVYNHNLNGGTIPTATWADSSNCNVTGFTGSGNVANVLGIGQTFGNLTINNAMTGYLNLFSATGSITVNGTLTVGPANTNLVSFSNTTGTITANINKLNITGGSLNGVGSFAIVNLNIATDLTISNEGIFTSSTGNGTANVKANNVLLNGNGVLQLVGGTAAVPNQTLTVVNDFIIDGDFAQLNMKPNSNSSGAAIVNVGRNFSSNNTDTEAVDVDFGTGTVANNAINITGNLTHTGNGVYQTTSSNTAKGFVFKGGSAASPSTISYSGVVSDYTNYVIDSNAYVKLLTDITLGESNTLNPVSLFTVNNLGTIDFDDKSIIGHNKPRFITAAGATLITANNSGIGGTASTGSLRSFTSTGTGSTTNGRAHLVDGVNYVFNGNTISPFPTTTFGSLGSLTINNSQVVSNRTSDLTVVNNVNLNANSGFTLNSTSGNLILGGLMTIENNSIFDNAGENQITQGGSGSVLVKNGGKFITKDEQGFSGTNAAIPTITNITLEPTSIVEYGRVDNQTISNQAFGVVPNQYNYQNLLISGSGIKTLSAGETVVNEKTFVDAAELKIPGSADNAASFVLNSKKGIVVATTGTAKVLFESGAQLLQEKDASNSGKITMLREATVPSTQYNYWASPVKDQILYGLYGALDMPDKTVKIYNTATDFFINLPKISNPKSVFGKGYSIKGPTTATATPITSTFVGEPNNEKSDGINTIDLSALGNNYNLIGNPYPSNLDLMALYNDAINNDKFYNDVDETPTVYFWDNSSNTDTTQQGSAYVNQNYAIFNLSLETGTGAPRFGTTGKEPNGIVKPGQGFIIRAAEATGQVLTFKNDYRTASAGANGVYFKGSSATTDKFWLSLTTPKNIKISTAVGYNDSAENTFERFDSAIFSEDVSENFYSLSSNAKKLAIQGRKYFTPQDVIPLGVKSIDNGIQKISLESKEGVFESQNIYLKDKLLNIITNLSQGAYEFTSIRGANDNRFEIVYEPSATLGTGANTKESLQVYRNGESFVVKSGQSKIDEVEVFDASGRLFQKVKGGSTEVKLDATVLPSGMYILKINRSNETISKKIIK